MKAIPALVAALTLAAPAVQAVTCVNNLPPGNPDAIYQVHGNGTVTDTRTGLTWKRCAEGQSWNGSTCTGSASRHTWANALALAEASTFAGHGDWRLPSLKELRSLVEECRYNPAINDTVFPNTLSSPNFWSGSPYAPHSGSAWYVDFYRGTANNYGRSNTFSVRLVRGGQ